MTDATDHTIDRTADRLAIQETLNRYIWGMADRDYDAWLACFTTGGTVDYTSAGGPAAPAALAKDWLAAAPSTFDGLVRHGGNARGAPNGDDEADVRSIYKVVMRIPGDPPTYMEACGDYRDRLERTAAGWRIAHRHENIHYLR